MAFEVCRSLIISIGLIMRNTQNASDRRTMFDSYGATKFLSHNIEESQRHPVCNADGPGSQEVHDAVSGRSGLQEQLRPVDHQGSEEPGLPNGQRRAATEVLRIP